jgi:hypothetical protein
MHVILSHPLFSVDFKLSFNALRQMSHAFRLLFTKKSFQKTFLRKICVLSVN